MRWCRRVGGFEFGGFWVRFDPGHQPHVVVVELAVRGVGWGCGPKTLRRSEHSLFRFAAERSARVKRLD